MSDVDCVDGPSLHQQRSCHANADAWTRSATIASGAIVQARIGRPSMPRSNRTHGASLISAVAEAGRRARWRDRHRCRRIDASSRLIAAANALGNATLTAITHHQLKRTGNPQPFHTVVAHFALLDEDLKTPLRAVHARLRPRRTLIVRACIRGLRAATDRMGAVGAWRRSPASAMDSANRCHGISRTLSSWAVAIGDAGFRVDSADEPMHTNTGMPLSLLISESRVDDAPRG